MNPNVRPAFPNQRPPPQQQHQHQHQQQQQQQQSGGNPAGRTPITSPFQRQDHASGQTNVTMNPNFRPLQHQAPANPSSPVRPAGVAPGTVPPQRPMQQQQQPRPQAPTPPGQQPLQFAGPGRPPGAPFNNGGQGQLRSGTSSPQAQPSLAMRPPPLQPGHQQQHQQQQQAHQPLVNGANIRPSASHPNLTGSGPGMPPGSRMAPPSPNMTSTRSPQIRPLQQTHGNGPMPQHHQPQQPHHQPNLRPSASHPHLAQQAGIRPPPTQGSPVLAHQTAIRPPTPLMQHQPRPRPPQAGPHGQPPSPFYQTQQIAPGHSVQLDLPSMNGGQASNGAPSPHQRPHLPPSQDMHQQQQRSPGARPILDQMRQQTQPLHPTQSPGSPQNHQNMNPAQRPPQRPTAPSQTQPLRQQQQGPGSVPLSPQRPQTKEAHTSSPPAHGHDGQAIDTKASHGEHGRVPNASPQQHNNALAANQRPANPQTAPGARPHPQQGYPGPAGFPAPHHPPRPLQAPGSPAQRPLGATEIKLPGPAPNMAPRQASAPQQPQKQQESQPQEVQQPITLVEPDALLSDSDAYADEDDIEGGGTSQTPPKSLAAQEVAPPPQPKPAAGGPPLGPPRGPPKGDNHGTRKPSGTAGSGPVRIMQPSNNPSSPPASAFPPMGPPKPRVRPPPGNANITPYRPPERPSQAPVMYSQSGQPTFTQPFPAQGDKGSAPATSMVPQGADATSSSVRPREGGLQKRAVAGDNNAAKSDSPASQLPSPPSPKLHGLKGPAILSVSTQKSLKTWAIRGGIVYLGYTAVFSCPPETTGVKGLYCKTTNGIGGLVKPFVAPHYNAHVGPHVDRYIAPVARQGQRIYLKVADPVVQGALSVAGTVYKSTAKKHVDSAKEQSKAADKEAVETPAESAHDQPLADRVSRQPIHVQEPAHTSDNTEEAVDHDESIVEAVEKIVAETPEEVAQHVEEEVVEQAAPIEEVIQEVVEEAAQSPEEPAVAQKETSNDLEAQSETVVEEIKHDEPNVAEEHEHVAEEDTNAVDAEEHEPIKDKASEGSIFDKVAAFKDSLKGLHKDTKGPEQETQSEEASQADVVPPTDSHVPADSTPEEVPAPVEEETPSTESVESTAESTLEFSDKPTVVSEESESAPVETAEAAMEPPVPVPEETVVPEAVESPVAEEESRETLPVVTEVVDDAVLRDSVFTQEHDQQEQEQQEQQPLKQQEQQYVFERLKEENEGANEEEALEKQQEQVVEEEKEATIEQQAAPASEVEGEAGHKGHDEL
ncbi:hypothetical protein BGX23_010868 [Mortierella sp. AD031]|nr:hypothetical protein BGX23_010868 [Mortierella sp. AD031]